MQYLGSNNKRKRCGVGPGEAGRSRLPSGAIRLIQRSPTHLKGANLLTQTQIKNIKKDWLKKPQIPVLAPDDREGLLLMVFLLLLLALGFFEELCLCSREDVEELLLMDPGSGTKTGMGQATLKCREYKKGQQDDFPGRCFRNALVSFFNCGLSSLKLEASLLQISSSFFEIHIINTILYRGSH